MNNFATVAFAAVWLGGCATCHLESFVKPSLQLGERTVTTWSGEKQFTYSLSKSLEVTISDCNEIATADADFLCVNLTPNQGTLVKFSSKSYQLLSAEKDNPETLTLGDIGFQIVFIADQSGTFIPDSDPLTTVPDGSRESTSPGNKYAFQKRYAFSADSPFSGIESKTRFDVLVHHLRSYGFTIPIPRASNGTVSLTLPDLYVDGEKISFPKVIVKRVTENVCHRSTG